MGKKRQKVNWVTVDGLHWTGTEEVGNSVIVTSTFQSTVFQSGLTFQYLVIDLCVTDVTDVCKRLAGCPSFCWCQQFEASNDDCLG